MCLPGRRGWGAASFPMRDGALGNTGDGFTNTDADSATGGGSVLLSEAIDSTGSGPVALVGSGSPAFSV